MVQGRDGKLVTVIEEAIRSALVDTHTALPGRIVAYDAATQTATVAIELQREVVQPTGLSEAIPVPELLDVPVIFPRAGGFAMTFPVKPDDKCLILFAERDISGWMQAGTEAAPPSARKHSFSDAICLLGISPTSELLVPPPATDGLEIRSDDGVTKVRIQPSEVAVFVNNFASFFVVNAAGVSISSVSGAGGITMSALVGPMTVSASGKITLTRGANELLAVISTALGLIATSLVGGLPLSNAAAITAEQAKIDAIRL